MRGIQMRGIIVRLHENGGNYPYGEAKDCNQEKDERQFSKWIGIARSPFPKHEVERQGQKDIEMLFDRQGPKVAISSRKVTLDKEDVVKCWFYDPGPAVETMD